MPTKMKGLYKMARITKAMIYKSFGIEFKKGKIFHPVLGWISPLLVNGNEKIGKGIWHFSSLPTNEFFEVYINFVKYVLKGTCPCHCVGCIYAVAVSIKTNIAQIVKDAQKMIMFCFLSILQDIKRKKTHCSLC